MHYPREATTKVIEMVESGALDPLAALRAALGYMSEADVADLAHSEGWVEDEADQADEADEDEADEDEADEDEAEAWHAYRWPTPAEIDGGRPEWAVVRIGSSPTEEGAVALLPRKEGQPPSGQIQKGKVGKVRNL
jgi:hypothetical protein